VLRIDAKMLQIQANRFINKVDNCDFCLRVKWGCGIFNEICRLKLYYFIANNIVSPLIDGGYAKKRVA